MKTLAADFNARNKWYNNRSSAVYPVDIKDKSDFILSFLNYWKLKNKLEKIQLRISIFNQNGTKKNEKKIEIVDKHYQISISKKFNLKRFKGMAQIEFFSKSNVRFPFPAISGFYISPKKYISGVHSAGRILNQNEINLKKKSFEESNFSLKFKKGLITPFFSHFNSSKKNKNNLIIVNLKTINKKLIKKVIIKNELIKPYQNKIFYLEDYFKENFLSKAFYASIMISSNDVYPRLICGNYHKKIHHYEVTHSYGVIKNKNDFIKNSYLKDKNVEHMSIMPFIKPKELKLKLRIFPTSLKSRLSANVYFLNEKTKKLEYKKKLIFDPSAKGLDLDINEKISFGFMTLKQKKIPSRLNTSYIYSNDNEQNLSTDIAAGFKSIEYPVKRNHWGSIWLSKKSNVKILIRRTTFFRDKTISRGTLNIYGKGKFKKEIELELKNNDYKIIDIKKLIKFNQNKITSFSWLLKINDNPAGLETFWTTYDKNFICGEHGF